MGLTVTETPNRTVNGLDSNVCAIKSQIPYRFLRQDYNRSMSGKQVAFSHMFDFPENPQIGDIWYLDFQESGNNENGVFPVTSILIDPGVTTSLTFGTVPNDESGFIFLNDLVGRENYAVALTLVDVLTGLSLLPFPVRFKPKQDGTLFVDLHGLFFGFQIPENDFRFRVAFYGVYKWVAPDIWVSDYTVGLDGFYKKKSYRLFLSLLFDLVILQKNVDFMPGSSGKCA